MLGSIYPLADIAGSRAISPKASQQEQKPVQEQCILQERTPNPSLIQRLRRELLTAADLQQPLRLAEQLQADSSLPSDVAAVLHGLLQVRIQDPCSWNERETCLALACRQLSIGASSPSWSSKTAPGCLPHSAWIVDELEASNAKMPAEHNMHNMQPACSCAQGTDLKAD